MDYRIPHPSYPEMESELSSLEIGFIDIMDEVNIIPISGGGLPMMPGHPAHTLVGHSHRLEPEHLLLPAHEPALPFLMDHELLRKRAPRPPITTLKKRDISSSGFDALGELDDSKKQRKPQVHKKCEHNTRKSECKLCGGSQICIHKRIKSRCKECGGSQICEHKKIRTRCKECKSSHERNLGDASQDGTHTARM